VVVLGAVGFLGSGGRGGPLCNPGRKWLSWVRLGSLVSAGVVGPFATQEGSGCPALTFLPGYRRGAASPSQPLKEVVTVGTSSVHHSF
jgi:hypothetical protein